jgi:hypothetical protein
MPDAQRPFGEQIFNWFEVQILEDGVYPSLFERRFIEQDDMNHAMRRGLEISG